MQPAILIQLRIAKIPYSNLVDSARRANAPNRPCSTIMCELNTLKRVHLRVFGIMDRIF
jgi:hypothetical protein